MYATDTTDITLDGTPYYCASRGHQLTNEALWHKTWPRFQLWLAENCRNHDVIVKQQVRNLTKLFVKSGDNLTKLWETVNILSNEKVQELTTNFGENINLC